MHIYGFIMLNQARGNFLQPHSQGLSSYLAPGGSKLRDPGNEVAFLLASRTDFRRLFTFLLSEWNKLARWVALHILSGCSSSQACVLTSAVTETKYNRRYACLFLETVTSFILAPRAFSVECPWTPGARGWAKNSRKPSYKRKSANICGPFELGRKWVI